MYLYAEHLYSSVTLKKISKDHQIFVDTLQ